MDLDKALTQLVKSDLLKDLERHGEAFLAVSGGRTPTSFFESLARESLDWNRVMVTLVDERWVAPDQLESNERTVKEHLLVGPAKSARFVGLKTQHESPKQAELEVQSRLAPFKDGFSALVLGMGLDGHTASFFPGSPTINKCLESKVACVSSATEVNAAGADLRMTLTLRKLLSANKIYLQLVGTDKLRVYKEALTCKSAELPISHLLLNEDREVDVLWAATGSE